jgi:hypothetical protein
MVLELVDTIFLYAAIVLAVGVMFYVLAVGVTFYLLR